MQEYQYQIIFFIHEPFFYALGGTTDMFFHGLFRDVQLGSYFLVLVARFLTEQKDFPVLLWKLIYGRFQQLHPFFQ